MIFNLIHNLSFSLDNDLPTYIVKLILNQHPIDRIREDLSLFLDANNTPFVDWLDVYLKNKKQPTDNNKNKLEVISASEIEEDILDFEEENVDEAELNNSEDQQENELNSSSEDSTSNKRKLDQLDDEQENGEGANKVLISNNKETVKLNKKSDVQKNNVINLKANKHLNDIGMMRRLAMEENKSKNQSQQQTTSKQPENNNNDKWQNKKQDAEFFTDLREKLNKNKEIREDNLDQEMDSTEEDHQEDDEKKEKCKFWPFCKKESECIYHHPTKQCEQFPNCKLSADKCMFIHPLCKFDAHCTKLDCPFLHIAKKQLPQMPAVPHHVNVECKFYPKCYNTNCQFIHPKLCIYGAMCKNLLVCPFKHPETATNIAKPHQCKFVANKNSATK